MAELLKCLQQLVNSIYPALCRARAVTAAATAIGGVDNPTASATRSGVSLPAHSLATSSGDEHALVSHLAGLQINPSSNENAAVSTTCCKGQDRNIVFSCRDGSVACNTTSSTTCPRLAEVSSALLLYFACVPQQPIMQELVKQLKAASKWMVPGQSTPHQTQWLQVPEQQQQHLPQGRHGISGLLLHTPEYQQALRAAAAVLSTNWHQFTHIYHTECPPSLVKAVMGCHLERLRRSVVVAAVATYRTLPSDVLLRWLALTAEHDAQQQQQLIGILQQAADGGCRGASVALHQCLGSVYAAGDNGSKMLSGGPDLPAILQFRGV
jgi:hypothetical protein